MATLDSLADELDRALEPLNVTERLRLLRREVPGRMVFTSSFGLEDQVLTHVIATAGLDIAIATLDTGRLFPETYAVWAETEARYGLPIRAYYPAHEAVEAYVTENGIDGFRASVAARQACCAIRKTEPLRRALAGAAAWITGLRADQSAGRGVIPYAGHDAQHRLVKVNPLRDWTRARAVEFAAAHDVPLNALHGRGFLSIGCAPCTRAVAEGEPERAGRWWWEQEAAKECGLHVGPDGRLVRSRAPEEAA